LQVTREPCKDGVLPLYALIIINDRVVFAINNNKSSGASQEFESREHLDTLANGHIGICIAMEEEQRGVYLVGIEQRTLVYIKVFTRPRIAVGHRHLAVTISPISLTPIAGVVANAGMRYGSSEDISLRLQVLSLDLTRQAENVFRLAIWLVLSGALLMVGLVGLLFGLNRVLSDVAALWVFFGIFFVSLLIIAVLFRKVSADYREQGSRVAETLQDIRSDIAYLRGEIDKDADDEATGA